MLSGYQCEVIAYLAGETGEIICEECAVSSASTVAVARAERGLSSPGLSPLIRYSVDEEVGRRAEELADEEASYAEDPAAWQAAYDDATPYYPCDSCGREIS